MFSAVFLPFALSATLFFPLLVLGQVSTAPDAPPVGESIPREIMTGTKIRKLIFTTPFLQAQLSSLTVFCGRETIPNFPSRPMLTLLDVSPARSTRQGRNSPFRFRFLGSRQPGCDRYMAFSDVSSPGGPFCGCPTTTLVGYGASRDGAGVRFVSAPANRRGFNSFEPLTDRGRTQIYFPSYGAWLFKGCGFIAGLEPSSSIMSGGGKFIFLRSWLEVMKTISDIYTCTEECSLFCNNRRVGVGSPVLFLYTAFNYATGACVSFLFASVSSRRQKLTFHIASRMISVLCE